MYSINDILTFLSALSSIAVILGALFIIFQLRQNARLIQATLSQSRSNVALTLLERITHESFPRRRYQMHQILRRFRETNWEGAFESEDDFQVRNFAYIYELMGLMVKNGVVDLALVLDTLQYIVVRDWELFAPHVAFITKRYGVTYDAYGNFRWLAQEEREHLARRAPASASGPAAAGS
ncbi:MAG TPA: hypothetical protein VFF67_01865 [Thermoplasmata archaeon]|nr:hypothetical protein [Thermoplasmata archaeon]